VKTTVEPLEGNKIKLSVEVDEQEFERALNDAFRKISREVRIPGFRPGKVPRRILEARIGSDVAREQALRDSLPGYYAQAVRENDVDVIAPPEIDITGGADDGPVAFDAVVEVRPRITVPGYGSLRVEVPAVEVTDEEIDAQVERLRSQFGELAEVDRPARGGDHVTIDIAGSFEDEPVEGLTADDYLYEVDSEAVVPEIDARLHGAKVGDILEFDAEHPDPEEDGQLHFRILVKDIKEKVLPELDDEWANEASEFETLDALRADIAERIGNMKRVQAQLALRNGVVDSLVELVDEEPPDALVQTELERRANDLVHRLSHQGATLEQYLEATGRSQEELLAELRESAVPSVKADLALRAVAEMEDLHATDDEVDAEIASLAERLGQKPAAVRKEFERAGQVQAVRSDIRKGKALEWLVEHAEIVDPDGQPVDRSELQPPADQPETAEDEPAQPDEETVE
jgi:trigger factor